MASDLKNVIRDAVKVKRKCISNNRFKIIVQLTRDGYEVLAVGRSLRLHYGNLRGHLLTIMTLAVWCCCDRLSHQDLGVVRVGRLKRNNINHADISGRRRLQDNFFLEGCAAQSLLNRLAALQLT